MSQFVTARVALSNHLPCSLDYVVQGHRFDILEDIGCFPSVYNVTLAYPLYLIWAPLLAIISFVYSGTCLMHRRFFRFPKLIVTTSADIAGFLASSCTICIPRQRERGRVSQPLLSIDDTGQRRHLLESASRDLCYLDRSPREWTSAMDLLGGHTL